MIIFAPGVNEESTQLILLDAEIENDVDENIDELTDILSNIIYMYLSQDVDDNYWRSTFKEILSKTNDKVISKIKVYDKAVLDERLNSLKKMLIDNDFSDDDIKAFLSFFKEAESIEHGIEILEYFEKEENKE